MRQVEIVAFLGIAMSVTGMRAATISSRPLEAPAFPDAEVSTNIAMESVRGDVAAFEVRMELAGTVSNCVQTALGRDLDGDGDLSPAETDLVLGWRGGRYFVEDVAHGIRSFDTGAASAAEGRFLRMAVSMDADGSPRVASFTDEAGACFTELSAGRLDGLFQVGWNLVKVTRRGVGPAGELCRVRRDCRSFHLVFR